MKTNEVFQVLFYFGLLIGLTPVVGRFMARAFERKEPGSFEKFVYRLGRVDAREEMSWKRYFFAVLIFNVIGILSLMAIEMTQVWLPLNPQKFPNVPWALALNTAISFMRSSREAWHTNSATVSATFILS